MATGFLPNQWGVSDITGPNGVKLTEVWKDEYNRNYHSITVPGLPNFFVLIGTNSPITNLSLIDIADIGVDYVLKCIEAGEFTAMAPKQEAATKFGQELADYDLTQTSASLFQTGAVSGCTVFYD